MATPSVAPDFDAVLRRLEGVEGWLSDDQARRLWDRARELRAEASVVEIGSYRGRSTIVLATAAPPEATVVAIDPHGGNDRAPIVVHGTVEEGEADHQAFLDNLAAAGVSERVRHLRRFSFDAVDAVPDGIDLLYIDGAHGFRAARDDIRSWTPKVRRGGTVLIHDAFSSIGVTLALLTTSFVGSGLRYVGRSRSMVELRCEPLTAGQRAGNLVRQMAQLPWFARNVVIKALIVAHLAPVARLLGHRGSVWPY
ncbi:MAG: class I SAM-dependent methyltransferase [Acidimicrobiales bacterium]